MEVCANEEIFGSLSWSIFKHNSALISETLFHKYGAELGEDSATAQAHLRDSWAGYRSIRLYSILNNLREDASNRFTDLEDYLDN